VATLTILKETDTLQTIHTTGETIQRGIGDYLDRRGIPHVFTGRPAMFGVMFTDHVPSDYRDWATTDHGLYDAVAVEMMRRGAFPEPDSREPWFLCEAHAGKDEDRICQIFEESLDAVIEARAR
jgi:glutamate-1-semialdehyde 2,1-aminomutase